MTNQTFEVIIAVFTSVFASSGFWMFISKRQEAKSAYNQLLVALARDRIVYLGKQYITKGCVCEDEYAELIDLYQPYKAINKNGRCKKIMSEVNKLPIRTIGG